MKTQSVDQDGGVWDMAWGVSDIPDTLRDVFGIAWQRGDDAGSIVLQDPLYAWETKTLSTYTFTVAAASLSVAMAEITPGVYAVGVKRSRDQPDSE
ncbi:hypothetical protein V8J82_20905 [Gymnodinialimonas sp. 2305UL16-5]|uniref:hypothetical protein n=1 Tax=Gymnodinialimonas mytili TaxID=3126503 RepID=UPI0030A186F3